MEELVKELSKNESYEVEKTTLSKNTTYKVGGNVVIIYPKDLESLIKLLEEVKKKHIKYMILGNGSNTLFSDKDYDGIIIRLKYFDKILIVGNNIVVGAGFPLVRLSYMAKNTSLTGLEFASGIPGTVGGAIFMNAGAYKSDMGYIVRSVKVLTDKLELITINNKDMNFHYRTSFLKQHPNYICLEALITLKKGKKENIEEVMNDRMQRRKEDQPINYPSAGSVFRNPEGLFAGKLIEDLHLKGKSIGGAEVSEKHANFIINKNKATASDIRNLILYVKDKVKETYNVDLIIEQEFINWDEENEKGS